MKIVPWLGWLLLAFLIVNFLAGYGTRWQLGRYAMPKSLLAPDGKHLDGSEPDDVTLALAQRGIEEESYLVALGILLHAVHRLGIFDAAFVPDAKESI